MYIYLVAWFLKMGLKPSALRHQHAPASPSSMRHQKRHQHALAAGQPEQLAPAACAGRLSSLRHAACAMQMCTKSPGAKTSLHVQMHVLLAEI
jgi:hypothetical protein